MDRAAPLGHLEDNRADLHGNIPRLQDNTNWTGNRCNTWGMKDNHPEQLALRLLHAAVAALVWLSARGEPLSAAPGQLAGTEEFPGHLPNNQVGPR